MRDGLTVAGVAVVVALLYVLECWAWPLGRCRRCKGAGQHQAPWGVQAWRLCRRCHGRGKRLRIGRRLWNFYRRLRTS